MGFLVILSSSAMKLGTFTLQVVFTNTDNFTVGLFLKFKYFKAKKYFHEYQYVLNFTQ